MTCLRTWQATRSALFSSSSALPTLCNKPWRASVSSLRSSFHFIISPPSVAKDTAPALTPSPPATTTRSPRWSIMCCYLPPTLVLCLCSSLLHPPTLTLLLSVPRRSQDVGRGDPQHCQPSSITPLIPANPHPELTPTHLRGCIH